MVKKVSTPQIAAKTEISEDVSHVGKRSRISQSDVPAYSLSDSLRIAQAVFENYAGEPTKPLDVAAALGMSPNSSTFKMLTGASIAYGLTDGGYNAANIILKPLAERMLQPLEEDEAEAAMREALTKPRIIGEFLNKYDGKQVPRDEIAVNVITSIGCPRERASEVFELIITEAKKLGLITEIKGNRYVNLKGSKPRPKNSTDERFSPIESETGSRDAEEDEKPRVGDKVISPNPSTVDNRRVFITHGKNKEFVEPIKRLLSFGELTPVVSVESQSVSQPVPEKVMADMRGCAAAIIHVAAEQTLIDRDAKEHVVLNPNVLIEIGAAMALYGKRFILLVREGVKLPSNLQGLYEVRYSSDQLDGDATIRLMEAIKALKETPHP